MLFIVSTPIGNLGDLSQRAIDTLTEVDYVLCEDTRVTKTLINRFEIKAKLVSFHKFSEAKKEERVLEDLREGRKIALVSDGGMPGLSDPGQRLIDRCRQEGLELTVIPGPSALTTALVSSGFMVDPFQFVGFLPKKEGEKRRRLAEILSYSGVTVAFEAPSRLIDTLTMLQEVDPTRELCVARELTKRYEEVVRGTAEQLLAHWKEVRGEIVLLVGPPTKNPWETLSPCEHVTLLEEEYGLDRKEAIKLAAQLRDVPKREVYGDTIKDQRTQK